MNKLGVLTHKEDLEVLKELKNDEDISKPASLSWDGKNLFVRIPKEIADFFDLNKNNRFKKKILFNVAEKNGEIKKTFDIVNRKEPKRKFKKKAK
ncbi:MAG: hypothetical protein ABFQ65_04135 [Nanoarchaeota archaeon]